VSTTELEKYNTPLKEQITKINSFVKQLELVLNGYKWTGREEKYVYTGEVLAGTDVISTCVSLITPYANNSNLITVKDPQEWAWQRYYTAQTYLREVMDKAGYIAESQKKIFEIFYETLINIGDIIVSSRSIIKDIIAPEEEKKEL